MKKSIQAAICSIILLGLFWSGDMAQGASVQVELPVFEITLNDRQIENFARQYPLIVYKDITYFPMTFFDTRFLGLESNYTQEAGLEIIKTGIVGGYYDNLTYGRNPQRGTAQIVAFPIRVNGGVIENGMEEYPLLLYRDITYFPLTWRFAVDEFGWEYSFDYTKGLIINSSGADSRMDSMTVAGA